MWITVFQLYNSGIPHTTRLMEYASPHEALHPAVTDI